MTRDYQGVARLNDHGIHRPSVYAAGTVDDMEKAKDVLIENRGGHHAYLRQARTGLSDEKITEPLEAETWMLVDKVSLFLVCR